MGKKGEGEKGGEYILIREVYLLCMTKNEKKKRARLTSHLFGLFMKQTNSGLSYVISVDPSGPTPSHPTT